MIESRADLIAYTPPPPSRFTRFLWWCAGADAQILAECPYADHVKMAGLGGIVFGTGILAALSSGYAISVAFGSHGANEVSTGTAVAEGALAVVFGLLWGLLILNLDRYIVASTGKGDGTDRITMKEFLNALPRLFMALVIGAVMSAPLEMRIFKTEVDVRLQDERAKLEAERQAAIETKYAPELERLRLESAALQRQSDSVLVVAKTLTDDAMRELDGKGGSGNPGDGPRFRRKLEYANQAKTEAEALGRRNATALAALATEDSTLRAQKAAELAGAARDARGLDGISTRIRVAHEVAGPAVTWTLRLLLIFIEVAPIFFKLMVIKGPYDYLDENLKELVKARRGIATEHQTIGTDVVGFTELHEPKAEFLRRLEELRAQFTVNSAHAKDWTDQRVAEILGRGLGAAPAPTLEVAQAKVPANAPATPAAGAPPAEPTSLL